MESDKIKVLLEKYWEGESNLEEEKTLRDYFQKGQVPPEFRKEADLFSYYSKEGNKELTQSRDVFSGLKKESPGGGRVVQLVWNGLKVAAVVLVLVTAGWLVRNEIKSDPDSIKPLTDSFEDPNQAFEETKKALKLLSDKMGKGKSQATRFKAFSEAQNKAKNLRNDKEEKL